MANEKKPATATATTATETKPAETKPESVEEKTPKGTNAVEWWPTAEKAQEVARGRTKGAYRSFEVVGKDGAKRYCTANHIHFISTFMLVKEMGFVITEIGKTPRAAALPNAEAILGALGGLPESEIAKIREQLAKYEAEKKAAPAKK